MQIEWLILADAAEVTNGKLYLLGGGWNRITVNKPFPIHRPTSIAMAIKVPWHQTNELHTFDIEINDADGKSLGKARGNFEVGRPVGMPQGMDQRVQLAINLNISIPKEGSYEVVVMLDGSTETRREFPYYVIPGHLLGGAGPTPQSDEPH